MGRLAREQHVIHRQEKLAMQLLDACLPEQGPAPPLDVQLDVFERMTKWVYIKNKLGDLEETDIDRFKRRINGTEAEAPKGRRARGDPTDRLDAIKARLPRRGAGDTDGDSGDPGVEVPTIAGG